MFLLHPFPGKGKRIALVLIALLLEGCLATGPSNRMATAPVSTCYQIGTRRPYGSSRALFDAIAARRKGERNQAIVILESGLESLYVEESPDFAEMGLVEQMLADLLSDSGEHERATVCHIVGKTHFKIGVARTSGANAPDTLSVPYPKAERQDGAQQ